MYGVDKNKAFLIISSSPDVCGHYRTMIEREKDFAVVSVSYPESAFDILLQHTVDFAVFTMDACSDSILSFLAALRKDYPAIPVLVITGDHGAVCVDDVCRAGADGFLLKHDESLLIPAVRTILSGKRYISEIALNISLQRRLMGCTDTYNQKVIDYSFEGHEVYQLATRGFGTDKIAEILNISREKVISHTRRLANKTYNVCSAK